MTDRSVVRQLWHSNDAGRTWKLVDVLAGSPLSGGVQPGVTWHDGYGNLYRSVEEATP